MAYLPPFNLAYPAYQPPGFTPAPNGASVQANRVMPNTPWLSPAKKMPTVDPSATLRNSFILGDVTIGPGVHVVNATIRADEGTPFYIGAGSNVQDNVLIHGHHTFDNGQWLDDNLVSVPGKGRFSVYIGSNVSLAHSAIIHGPVKIDDHSFISFRATIDRANVGKNCEIGAHSYISNVTIPDNTGIRAGAIITKQEDVAKNTVPLSKINTGVLQANREMAFAYHPNFQFQS